VPFLRAADRQFEITLRQRGAGALHQPGNRRSALPGMLIDQRVGAGKLAGIAPVLHELPLQFGGQNCCLEWRKRIDIVKK
jgi:hypothetical protein